MDEKRYQIFISSTYEDLKEERQKVTQAILKLYHFPIGMEMFHADNEEQWEQIKKTIDMSDYFVLIIGRYCGTLIDPEGISYTEKEYNYALSKGIPVLSFIISNDAKKESYGVETGRQQKALQKFIERAKKLPCEFWSTPDELAFQVVSTLSIKFRENNRKGWVPYNPLGISFSEEIDDTLVGEYVLLYYSKIKKATRRLIVSRLVIEKSGFATFYNNTSEDSHKAEYIYRGSCCVAENTLYLFLKNEYSNERVTLYLIKSAGNLERFIGLCTAMSSDMTPVCIKIACFKKELFERGINESLIDDIIKSNNNVWGNDILVFEEGQKNLFFSNVIIN